MEKLNIYHYMRHQIAQVEPLTLSKRPTFLLASMRSETFCWVFDESPPEAYLEPSRTSALELFHKND